MVVACAASAAAHASTLAAAEFHPVSGVRARAPTPSGAARDYLHAAATPLRLSSVALSHRGTLAAGSSWTVLFAQHYMGIPVVGASAAVRVGPGGNIALVMLDVARDLRVETNPAITPDDAERIVAERLGVPLGTVTRAAREILPLGAGAARLVWTLRVPTADGGMRVRVDAHLGTIVEQSPLALRVKGRVYPMDPIASPTTEDRLLEGIEPLAPQRLTGWNGNLTVANFVGEGVGGLILEQTLGANAGSDFLYDPPAAVTDPADAFSQVNAYYHLARSRNYYATAFGLNTTGPSWKLVAAVNVQQGGVPFDGAYFTPLGLGPPWNSPNLLAFGQGADMDFAYDADALLHEFAHYVTYNAVGFNAGSFAMDDYGLSPFSIAIDEGVADYFACTQNDDPVLGAPTLGPMGLARDLRETSKRCPDDVVGEAHLDGAIIGSLGWSLREALGRAIADELIWGATSLLPYRATLGDFARGIRQGAQDLENGGALDPAQVETIEVLLHDRGLDDCDHEISLAPGASRKTLVFGLDAVGRVLNTTCEELKGLDESLPSLFHFRTQPGEDAIGVRFTVDLEPLESGDLDWAIYVRKNEHVTFVVHDPVPAPVVAAFDYSVEHLRAKSGELVIDADSSPPFDPSASYHVVMTHRNCPGVAAQFSASVLREESAAPAETGTELGGGCSCGAARSRGLVGAWLISLIGFALAWRKERTRRGSTSE